MGLTKSMTLDTMIAPSSFNRRQKCVADRHSMLMDGSHPGLRKIFLAMCRWIVCCCSIMMWTHNRNLRLVMCEMFWVKSSPCVEEIRCVLWRKCVSWKHWKIKWSDLTKMFWLKKLPLMRCSAQCSGSIYFYFFITKVIFVSFSLLSWNELRTLGWMVKEFPTKTAIKSELYTRILYPFFIIL